MNGFKRKKRFVKKKLIQRMLLLRQFWFVFVSPIKKSPISSCSSPNRILVEHPSFVLFWSKHNWWNCSITTLGCCEHKKYFILKGCPCLMCILNLIQPDWFLWTFPSASDQLLIHRQVMLWAFGIVVLSLASNLHSLTIPEFYCAFGNDFCEFSSSCIPARIFSHSFFLNIIN